MRKSITINPTTRVVVLPKELVEDGFAGELDAFPNAVTFTMIRPGANLEDVEASLLRTLEDIRQRMRMGMDRSSITKPAPAPKPKKTGETQDKPRVEERLDKLESEFDKMRRKIKEGGTI